MDNLLQLRHLACLLMFGASELVVVAFNIDVLSAVVHMDNTDTSGFGHAAEFVETTSTTLRLLVTAPREKVYNWTLSGIHYYCDPVRNDDCVREYSMPLNYTKRLKHPYLGEVNEAFGLSLLVINQTTPLTCGPLWSDKRNQQDEYFFPIGRCLFGCCDDVAPYVNSAFYIVREGSIMVTNMAMFGFATATDGEGQVIITAPGYRNAQGELALYNTRSGKLTKMDIGKLIGKPDHYIGYAVSFGNFCREKRVCFAVSDRRENGTVYLFEKEAERDSKKIKGKNTLKLLQTFVNPQAYASFGASTCAMDLNGDGWADLLVGAPLYSSLTNDKYSYDEGRVFVYLSHGDALEKQDNLQPIVLHGSQKVFSRFGSAVGNIGDINKDSFQDVAIGAPMEDNGVGAVYIYLGGHLNSNIFSQRISGNDFKPSLTSFGYHISKPTLAIGEFQYPAFAVGSPHCGAVVVLRTRPLANVKARLSASPNPVMRDNSCPDEVSLVEVTGCVAVQVCFTLDFDFKNDNWTPSLDYSLVTDALVTKSWRLQILENSNIVNAYHNTTVFLTRNKEECFNYTVAIMRINRNPSTRIIMQVTFDLNMTSDKGSVIPMMNDSSPRSIQEEVKFSHNCGEGQKCQADLQLTGVLFHLPLEPLQPYNIVNHTNEVVIHLALYNSRETTFGIQLTVNVTGRIKFASSDSENTTHHVECESETNVTSGYSLTCPIRMTLYQNMALAVNLHFRADSVPLEPEGRYIEFDITALPDNSNDDVNHTNNNLKLLSEMRIFANLQVNGYPETRSLQLSMSNITDPLLVHKLLLTNRGPSFLPPTNVIIRVPYQDRLGRPIIGHLNVTIESKDRTRIECQIIQSADLLQESVSRTTSTPSTGASISSPDYYPEIEPARRRRKSVNDENMETTINSSRQFNILDCETYYCQVLRCPVTELQQGEIAVVEINLSLLRARLPFDKKVDRLIFETYTSVAQPNHPLFQPWNETSINSHIHTSIYLLKAGQINIWIIIGGVVAGVLLIIIIAVIAWKMGFFERKRLQDLERLKRESGFYNLDRVNTKRR